MLKEITSSIRNMPAHTLTAIQSVWRNGVMSVSSVFAVTVTLLLIGLIGLVAINIQDMTKSVEEGLTIHVRLERELSEETVAQVGEQISSIGFIKSVDFSSKDQELDKVIEGFGDDGATLYESFREDNPLGDAYNVEVESAAYIKEIAAQISNIEFVSKVNYGGDSTATLVKTLESVRNGGAIFVVALVIIALMLISNTIKVTITARQTEISIMRMVGASNWYIRIPFMLEGIMIGLLGSILPCLCLYFGYSYLYQEMGGMFFSSMLILRTPMPFVINFSIILALLGSGVGLVGSFFSVHKFLKF